MKKCLNCKKIGKKQKRIPAAPPIRCNGRHGGAQCDSDGSTEHALREWNSGVQAQ